MSMKYNSTLFVTLYFTVSLLHVTILIAINYAQSHATNPKPNLIQNL